MLNFEDRFEVVRERIEKAAGKTGRSAKDITLVTMTKGVPAQEVMEAQAAGIGVFGENKVHEAELKILEVNSMAAKNGIPAPQWHMVGHLQSNKVKTALPLFSLIQSVDTVGLAKAISGACLESGKKMEVLLEVNLSGEKQRYGFSPDGIYTALETISQMQGIQVMGFMGIAPNSHNPQDRRRAFKTLKNIFSICKSLKNKNLNIKYLSMGMSDDFETAIEEGANMIRLGRALFGERH